MRNIISSIGVIICLVIAVVGNIITCVNHKDDDITNWMHNLFMWPAVGMIVLIIFLAISKLLPA